MWNQNLQRKKKSSQREDGCRLTQNTFLISKKEPVVKVSNQGLEDTGEERERGSTVSLFFHSDLSRDASQLNSLGNSSTKMCGGPLEMCNVNTAISRKRLESYLFQNELV